MQKAAAGGIGPAAANMTLALRSLEAKTTDPYLAGWRKRVTPTLGHIPVRLITHGAVDRAVNSWIADECGRSTVKNSFAVLVRILEQAERDGLIDRNPARITGWQRQLRPSRGRTGRPSVIGPAQLACAGHARRHTRRQLRRPVPGLG